jgi:hypothetical protein
MTNNIPIAEVIAGQEIAGYVTKTNAHDTIIYGVFATTDEALAWAKNLANATIEPIYIPAFNRG